MPETALPPFSGDDPACVKCGHIGAFTTWRPPARTEHSFVVEDHLVRGEHLERRCERCEYRWAEATAEAAQ